MRTNKLLRFNESKQIQAHCLELKQSGASVAFVPTMGNLHAGHMSLVKAAKENADVVVVSIFVNPLQFGPNEDFDTYPRTLEADCEKLKAAGVDILFAPDIEQMYPKDGFVTHIDVTSLSNILCGASRPGFFQGVATVVCKLFQIVQPTCAIFGEKDFQQLQIICQMVRDLNLPIDIIGMPTVRDLDGLALSSRNAALTQAERSIAPHLYDILHETKNAIKSGQQAFAKMEQSAKTALEKVGFKMDYFQIRQANDLSEPKPGKGLAILAAGYLGNTRLIDNIQVES